MVTRVNTTVLNSTDSNVSFATSSSTANNASFLGGTPAASYALASAAGLGGIQYFTTVATNQTFSIPAGVTKIKVTVVGGGGGSSTGGAGGQSRILSGTQTVATVTASGGAVASGETPGAGGAATGGTLNSPGQAGGQGGYLASGASLTATAVGGFGGEGYLGRGRGARGNSNIRNAGTPISASGGGGGGGLCQSFLSGLTSGATILVDVGAAGTVGSGSDNTAGIVIFEW